VQTEQAKEEIAHPMTGELTTLLKLLAKPDAFKLFCHAGEGIRNSTYAIEELNITPKKYYSRLKDLVNVGIVKKRDGAYRQTALGRMVYDRFLPAMGKAVDARDELEFLAGLEGIEIENEVKKRILEELGVQDFSGSTKVRMIDNYESMVVDVIDLCNEAEKSIIMASNYMDVRVMEAVFRAGERGVTNSFIVGKSRLSSKLKNLRMMLSLTFAKTVLTFVSDIGELKNTVRFAELPYSFCIVDGHRNIIEISDTIDDRFLAAFSVDDRGVGETATKFYEKLWKAGEIHSALEAFKSLKSS